MSKWADRFLVLAEHIADWSKDPSTKVGCVIVDKKNRIISTGYNGFPRGVSDLPSRLNDRPTKYLFVCHAERNALDNSPMQVDDCILYVTLPPCNECMKSIIQRGIRKVITYRSDREDFYNWKTSEIMAREAGVELIFKEKEGITNEIITTCKECSCGGKCNGNCNGLCSSTSKCTNC